MEDRFIIPASAIKKRRRSRKIQQEKSNAKKKNNIIGKSGLPINSYVDEINGKARAQDYPTLHTSLCLHLPNNFT